MAIAPTGLSRLIREHGSDTESPASSTVSARRQRARGGRAHRRAAAPPGAARHAHGRGAAGDARIFDAPAGALLLYRREDATLTLAAARGLAVAGAEALDVLRWGDEPGFGDAAPRARRSQDLRRRSTRRRPLRAPLDRPRRTPRALGGRRGAAVSLAAAGRRAAGARRARRRSRPRRCWRRSSPTTCSRSRSRRCCGRATIAARPPCPPPTSRRPAHLRAVDRPPPRDRRRGGPSRGRARCRHRRRPRRRSSRARGRHRGGPRREPARARRHAAGAADGGVAASKPSVTRPRRSAPRCTSASPASSRSASSSGNGWPGVEQERSVFTSRLDTLEHEITRRLEAARGRQHDIACGHVSPRRRRPRRAATGRRVADADGAQSRRRPSRR